MAIRTIKSVELAHTKGPLCFVLYGMAGMLQTYLFDFTYS